MVLNYKNKEVKKVFENILIKKGKKTNSEKYLKTLFLELKKKNKKNPNNILNTFIKKNIIKLKYIEIIKKKRWSKRKTKKKKNLYLCIFLNKNKQKKIPIKLLLKNKNKINSILEKKSKKKIFYYNEINKLKMFFF